jgi:tetratricopeptide (TPR) repeat protein
MSMARVLMIFTYRPEYLLNWGARSYHNHIILNRLSNAESLAMVSSLLGTRGIETNLEAFILEETEGIPFFIEEFVNSLKRLKIIEKKKNKYHLTKNIEEVVVPSTIQDVIMARVDSLPLGAKTLLQIGSAIEREFSFGLIKTASALAELELLPHLSALKDSELLYERGIYPETTYVFKHALTREVVYDSILTKIRNMYHEKIADAIEEIYKEDLDKHFGVLAEHYIAGEKYEKAADYSRLAAQSFENTGSISEAIVFAEKAVRSLERLPWTDTLQTKIIQARTALGVYLIRMFYYSEAKEAVEPVVDSAVELGYKKALPQILTVVGNYEYFVEENVPSAFKNLENALKISKELDDKVSLALTSWRLGTARALNCEFEEGERHFERVLGLNVAENSLWSISLIKSFQSFYVYLHEGRIISAYEASEEAIRMAEESGDIYSKAFAYTAHGLSCYGRGLFSEAIKYVLRGLDFCETINLSMWSAVTEWMLGEIYYEIAEFENAKKHFARSAWLMEHSSALPSWMTLNRIGLEMAKVMNNEKDIDLETLYAYMQGNRMKLFEGIKSRYIGDLLLNIDEYHLSEAEDWIVRAIEIHQRDGMLWDLAKDYGRYADLFKKKSDLSKAEEILNKAIEILKRCGADGWVEKYQEEQANLL